MPQQEIYPTGEVAYNTWTSHQYRYPSSSLLSKEAKLGGSKYGDGDYGTGHEYATPESFQVSRFFPIFDFSPRYLEID